MNFPSSRRKLTKGTLHARNFFDIDAVWCTNQSVATGFLDYLWYGYCREGDHKDSNSDPSTI